MQGEASHLRENTRHTTAFVDLRVFLGKLSQCSCLTKHRLRCIQLPAQKCLPFKTTFVNWQRTQNGLLINKSSRSISKHLLWNKYRYWLSKLQKIKLISQTYNSWWNSDEDTKRARWRPHTVLIKRFLTCLLPEKPKRRIILMGTKSPQTMIWNNFYQSKEEFVILNL